MITWLLVACGPAQVIFPAGKGDTGALVDTADADTDADSDADTDSDTDSDTDADTDSDTDTDSGCATWYRDADGDGYGDSDTSLSTCDPGEGWVEQDGDCDDGDADVHPGARETGDGTDQDCDGRDDDLAAEDASGWTILGDDAGDAIGTGGVWAGSLDGGEQVLAAAPERDAGAIASFDADDAALDLPWSSGREVTGVSSGDRFGASFVVLDDADEDGQLDLFVGAPEARGEDGAAGAAYLFDLGGAVGPVSTIDRATFRGSEDGDEFGASVGGGDLDGDGVTDLFVGATGGQYYRGTVYAWFEGGYGEEESEGWRLVGEAVDDALGSALAVGDVDNDGYDDLVTCASGSSEGGEGGGACWLVFGSDNKSGEDRIGDEADATFLGAAGDAVGDSPLTLTVARLDGDDALDIVLGAPGRGAVATWLGGSLSGTQTLAAADTLVTGTDELGAAVAGAEGPVGRAVLAGAPDGAGTGFLLDPGTTTAVPGGERASWAGAVSGDGLGGATAGGEDLDGDSRPDFVLAAPGSDDGAANAGKVYVLPGIE